MPDDHNGDQTPINTTRLRGLLERATPAPWAYYPDKNWAPGSKGAKPITTPQEGVFYAKGTIAVTGPSSDTESMRNAELIATLRNEGPALLNELEHLRIALSRADGALADAETVPTGDVEAGIRALTLERNRLRYAYADLLSDAGRLAQYLTEEGVAYDPARTVLDPDRVRESVERVMKHVERFGAELARAAASPRKGE